MITGLIAEEIDGEQLLLDRMVSALILGSSIAPDEFDNIATCAAPTDVG